MATVERVGSPAAKTRPVGAAVVVVLVLAPVSIALPTHTWVTAGGKAAAKGR